MSGVGCYEDNHAATKDAAEFCVARAIYEIEVAHKRWVAAQQDPTSTTADRMEAGRRVELAVSDFRLQWANVKMLLEARG